MCDAQLRHAVDIGRVDREVSFVHGEGPSNLGPAPGHPIRKGQACYCKVRLYLGRRDSFVGEEDPHVDFGLRIDLGKEGCQPCLDLFSRGQGGRGLCLPGA